MIKATLPGVAGNCVSGTAFSIAFITMNVEPLLHILAVIVGILASLATTAYYIVSWQSARNERNRAAAKRVRTARKATKRK